MQNVEESARGEEGKKRKEGREVQRKPDIGNSAYKNCMKYRKLKTWKSRSISHFEMQNMQFEHVTEFSVIRYR